MQYVHRSYVKKTLTSESDEMEDFKSVTFHRHSLVGELSIRLSILGQFLRKFVIGFHLQSFEQIVKFSESFYGYYDSVRLREKRPNANLSAYLR